MATAEISEKKRKRNRADSYNADDDMETSLMKAVANYLSNRGFTKTLARFLKESQCEEAWASYSIDLEDVFTQYKVQQRKRLVNAEKEKESHSDLESERDLKNTSKRPNGKSSSKGKRKKHNKKGAKDGASFVTDTGASEQVIPPSDNSTDDPQDKVLRDSKKRKHNEKDQKLYMDIELPIKAKRERGSSNKNMSQQEGDLKESKLTSGNALKKLENVKCERRLNNESLSPKTERESKVLTENGCNMATSQETNVLSVTKNKRKKHCSYEDNHVFNEEQNVKTDTEEVIRDAKVKKHKKKEKDSMSKMLDTKEQYSEGNDSTVNNKKEANAEKEEEMQEESDKKKVKKRNLEAIQLHDNEGTMQKNNTVDSEKKGFSSKSKDKFEEPSTAKAFQRVKLDEVQFSDPRLQDNSYWAKDGAEIGYGAKAQEVLGQVRGKDFRHEKTKKKRGSYKGGMIDLESRSIKFNYSDED
eukprot:TRINITY_DN7600_c0_g1_i4.p1 TRINITY_DN7600_c0_g1~~TRINITY_DN7600_c0_g1_i4.p1  ORF type:complete len:471 (+),score=146.09 TRINITY_DN7600_c0_g1_i4:204-1616(+)